MAAKDQQRSPGVPRITNDSNDQQVSPKGAKNYQGLPRINQDHQGCHGLLTVAKDQQRSPKGDKDYQGLPRNNKDPQRVPRITKGCQGSTRITKGATLIYLNQNYAYKMKHEIIMNNEQFFL